ncbi:MAG: ral secretion pathway protein [Candidatus Saccharibacteria bacterium]|nr:ral secretion pathway protein [Candidatus Saccharibacteria bacterium]
MISLNKKRQSGFTIVELLIVIVVIGILAAIVITTYAGIQSKGRNTKRTTDIGAIQQKLEAYYAENGNYPSLANMNDFSSGGFFQTSMKGLDQAALYDPSAADKSAANPLKATPAKNVYAYAPTNDSGASCESDATTCTKYTLTGTYEGQVDGKSTIVKTNLN